MTNLKRKSFYLTEAQYRQLVDFVYETYVRTGRRITESEVVRDALDYYFRTQPLARLDLSAEGDPAAADN